MEQPYGNLVSAIIRRLSATDVVIAVLAGKNPNVFYELGIRHTLRLNTIMLVEQWDEYPFDLQSYFSHRYSINSEPERRQLRDFVRARLVAIDNNGSLPDSPVIDVLQLAEYEQLRVVNSWETRRAAIVLQGLMGEVAGVIHVLSTALEDVGKTTEPMTKKGKRKLTPRKASLSWDMIDGFTKTRPIPGMSASAYQDAEDMYSRWRMFQTLWNELVEHAAEPTRYIALIATVDRYTMAFTHDLTNALNYVLLNRTAIRIPWANSMRQVEKLIPNIAVLNAVRNVIIDKANALLAEFPKFDAEFSGIPDSVFGRMSEPAAAAGTSLADLVGKHSSKKSGTVKRVERPASRSSPSARKDRTKRSKRAGFDKGRGKARARPGRRSGQGR